MINNVFSDISLCTKIIINSSGVEEVILSSSTSSEWDYLISSGLNSKSFDKKNLGNLISDDDHNLLSESDLIKFFNGKDLLSRRL
jgi:hypothetical protein